LLYFNPAGATSASQFGQDGFCGPSALTLTVTQQVAAGINCGA
jgi:UDP-glucose 4-epimerase